MKRFAIALSALALMLMAAETASAQVVVVGGGRGFGPVVGPGFGPGFGPAFGPVNGWNVGYGTRVGNNGFLSVGYSSFNTWGGGFYAPPVIHPITPLYPAPIYGPVYGNPWGRRGWYPGCGW